MKHVTATLFSVLALSGCLYPEVDEGGFPPGVDGGVDAAVAETGVDTGVDSNVWVPLPPTVSWCNSGTYNLPCVCAQELISAFTTCDAQVMQVRTNPARIAMASCIDTARDGAGCGNPYCEAVRSCYAANEAALTPEDEQAIVDAYQCIDAQLRAVNCVGAP